jgi:hypothetical protein
LSATRTLDQQPSHRDRRNRDEVRAILPRGIRRLGQAQVGFVHEIGRLHAGVAVATDVPAGQPSQLRVRVVDELIDRFASHPRELSLWRGVRRNVAGQGQ